MNKKIVGYIKQDIKDIKLFRDDVLYNFKALKIYLNHRTYKNFKNLSFELNLNTIKNLLGELAPLIIIYNFHTQYNFNHTPYKVTLFLTSLLYPFLKYSIKYSTYKSELKGINQNLKKMFMDKTDMKLYAYDYFYDENDLLNIKFYSNILLNKISEDDITYCLGGEVYKRKLINNRAFQLILVPISKKAQNDEYLKEKKGSLERLIKILDQEKISFEYIKSIENDIQTIHKFRVDISKLNPNKKKQIEYKLEVPKGYLEIFNSAGLTNFIFNDKPAKIYHFFDIFKNLKKSRNMELPFLFGIEPKTSRIIIKDFRKILHLLIGGESGEGKSNTLHQFVQTLLYWNDNISAFTIDLKGTELKQYKDLSNVKHVKFDFRNDFKEFEAGIDEIQKIFDDRFELFDDSEYRDIETYNKNHPKNKLNFILLIVDEANQFKLKLSKNEELFDKVDEITTLILRQGRSMGIHCIHTAQKVGDTGLTGYPSTWRGDFTNILSHNLREDLTAEKFFNEKSLIYRATHLRQGEFLFYDSKKSKELIVKSTYIPLDNKDNLILKALLFMDRKKIQWIENSRIKEEKIINLEKKEV